MGPTEAVGIDWGTEKVCWELVAWPQQKTREGIWPQIMYLPNGIRAWSGESWKMGYTLLAGLWSLGEFI